ncbi:MAG TPA: hypothetical protein PKA58_17380 [Polyangium sp.]|nr:hypothetical protein [Polyangium sp.]
MIRLALRSSLVLGVALGLTACGTTDDVEEMTGTDESALELGLSPAALEKTTAVDPALAADTMAKESDGDGCRTRVKDPENPNVVHVYLDNCTGRFGRHTRSGEITVTYSTDENGRLLAEHQSVWLTIDGQPATRRATAIISITEENRHVVWHGEKTVTNTDGEEVTRVADHVIDVDPITHCSVVNGTATITRSDKVVHAELVELTSCALPDGAHSCPTGTINATVEGRDVQITKSFDGTETATIEVVKPKGVKTKEVLLNCVAQP